MSSTVLDTKVLDSCLQEHANYGKPSMMTYRGLLIFRVTCSVIQCNLDLPLTPPSSACLWRRRSSLDMAGSVIFLQQRSNRL
jgi:hypothetical protein